MTSSAGEQAQLHLQLRVRELIRTKHTTNIARMYAYELLIQFMRHACSHEVTAEQNDKIDELDEQILGTYIDTDLTNAYAIMHNLRTQDELQSHLTNVIVDERKKILQTVRQKLGPDMSCIVCLHRPRRHLFKCSRCCCTITRYCSAACQRVDWPLHKVFCADIATAMQNVSPAVHDAFTERMRNETI
jgi:hypothetical protein